MASLFFSSDQFFTLLLAIFIAAVAIQLIYYWFMFGRFAFYKKKVIQDEPEPVSVVLSAKNEYPNLKKNLPLLLSQDYPEFEVVVVNDASDDETIFLLEDLQRDYKNIKVVNITQDLNFFKGKKFPLAIGIKSAKYENLLLTDADCVPASPNWIMEMSSNFTAETEIVLGYGKYEEHPNLLNKIIRYETAFTAIEYFSFALIGLPYMGVGRNLAYKKNLFIKSKGFISHYKVSSGDDDLFINQVATKRNTRIEAAPDSFTVSPPKTTFKSWWNQKRRHISAGKYYKFKHKILIGLYPASLIVTYITFILLLLLGKFFYLVLALFLIRMASQLIIFKKSFHRLLEKKLLLISPLIEVFFLGIYPVMGFINLVFKQTKWK
ncbi:MAG: glycosyltransferase [Bacteroidales bacterium]|nr:glycosyltransferase [Bacteroidales bacterium]